MRSVPHLQLPDLTRPRQRSLSTPARKFELAEATRGMFSAQILFAGVAEGISDVVIEDDRVSKQHFRIYSILYDKESRPDDPPLIYCEDLQSCNGTYINDVLIGNINCEKVGHLLSDCDVIEIRPYWKFRFHQPVHQSVTLDKALTLDLEVQVAIYSFCSSHSSPFSVSKTATLSMIACLEMGSMVRYGLLKKWLLRSS